MGVFLLNLDALLTVFLPRLELLPLIFLALFIFLSMQPIPRNAWLECAQLFFWVTVPSHPFQI